MLVLSQAGWQSRSDLEGLLMQLHRQAEIYWRQRGSINWTLKGDSLTMYFFCYCKREAEAVSY